MPKTSKKTPKNDVFDVSLLKKNTGSTREGTSRVLWVSGPWNWTLPVRYPYPKPLRVPDTPTRYRTFIWWFMKQFVLMTQDHPVNAAYLFKRWLLSFATTLGDYVSREHSTVQKINQVTGLTPAGVKRMICHHIQQNWCDLLPAYDEMASTPSLLLYYVSPPITIVEKTLDYIAKVQYLKVVEDLDVKEAPIYLYNVSQGGLLAMQI